jgi:hypothetical protein
MREQSLKQINRGDKVSGRFCENKEKHARNAEAR